MILPSRMVRIYIYIYIYSLVFGEFVIDVIGFWQGRLGLGSGIA